MTNKTAARDYLVSTKSILSELNPVIKGMCELFQKSLSDQQKDEFKIILESLDLKMKLTFSPIFCSR